MISDDEGFEWELATRAIRVGHQRTAEGEHGEPIFPTSSYVFANAAEAAARFSGEKQGNIYSRFTNPTVRNFEQRLAALEEGESCVAFSSGMAAILGVCVGLLKSGDHIVCSQSVFGTTTILFTKYMAKFGIETSFVSLTEIEQWQQAVKPQTRLFFIETPANPLTQVADIQQLSELAHKNDALLVVDNCFCTPVLQQPLKLGADIVVHSATKYLDGQGRAVGGAVVGDKKLVGEEVFGVVRTAGPTMSPFNAWVFLKGLETLNIRMKAHCDNALQLATWLQQQPAVDQVFYPGLTDHPQHALAEKQQSGFGGVLSFEVKGGRQAAWKLIDSTRLLSITANLGDVKSTITHPATTTHGRLSDEQKVASGITEGLVRIAVGLEAIADIQQDLRF